MGRRLTGQIESTGATITEGFVVANFSGCRLFYFTSEVLRAGDVVIVIADAELRIRPIGRRGKNSKHVEICQNK